MDFDINMLLSNGYDQTLYQYYYQLFNHRTIIFNKEIMEDIVETVYLPLKEFEDDDSTTPVTLILNCVGGSVSDGFFLADYLTHYQKPLNIIVCGYAASMAALILAAGGKNPNITRFCYPNSYALIHDGQVAVQAAEAKTAADIMAFNDYVDRQMRQFFIDNTNISPEEFDSHSRKQWFINPTEMKQLGLIDKIIGVDDNVC